MSDLYKEKSALYIARRLESKAHNDLAYCKKQAEEQERQLEGILKYKDECMDGLRAAKDTGLTPLHIRELQLLATHINSAVETITYKVNVSQKNIEVAEEVWQKQNEHYEKEKEVAVKNSVKVEGENKGEDSAAEEDTAQQWKKKVNEYDGNAPPTMARGTNKSHKEDSVVDQVIKK